MSNSLGDILADKKFNQPDEIQIIKDYVLGEFGVEPSVRINPHQIIIMVEGAALASELRMRLHELKSHLDTKKRLMITIR